MSCQQSFSVDDSGSTHGTRDWSMASWNPQRQRFLTEHRHNTAVHQSHTQITNPRHGCIRSYPLFEMSLNLKDRHAVPQVIGSISCTLRIHDNVPLQCHSGDHYTKSAIPERKRATLYTYHDLIIHSGISASVRRWRHSTI